MANSRNVVLNLAKLDHGPGDVFGWVQGWRFALADYLTTKYGVSVKGFRQSPFGSDTDDANFVQLSALGVTENEATYALRVLNRYRDWVRIAGRDY